MEIALFPCEESDVDICSDRNLFGLEYADDVVLLSENSSKIQVLLDRLSDYVVMFDVFCSLEVQNGVAGFECLKAEPYSYRGPTG